MVNKLVAGNVSVIVVYDLPSAFAAKQATKTIPVVFVVGADPVKLGLVDSFNQPRGNLTGVSVLMGSLGPKQLELLRELLPNSNKVALLLNPSNPKAQIDGPEIRLIQDGLHAADQQGLVFAGSGGGEAEAEKATDRFGQGHALSLAILTVVGRDAGDAERFPSAAGG